MSGGSRTGSAISKSTMSPSLADLVVSLANRGACTLGEARNVKGNCVKLTPLVVKGKRPLTGFNVFTHEISKLEIDNSNLMKTAAGYWKVMSDDEKAKYKAKAAKLKPPKVCPEGKELNDATGRCRITCDEGKTRNLRGNCVNVKPSSFKGKRQLTGFNAFTRELSKLENIDKSDFTKSASKLWALLLDEEKERYTAYATTGISRENCPDNKKRNLMGNCVYTYRSCKKGTEKNPMTLMCQEKCPEGTKMNLMGDCVNTAQGAGTAPGTKGTQGVPGGKGNEQRDKGKLSKHAQKTTTTTNKAPTHTKVKAMPGKTTEELQDELEAIDFSDIAGKQLIVWVQEIESDAGTVELPMLKIDLPKKLNKATIVSLITKKLTEPLRNSVPADVFAFYQLLAVLGLSEVALDLRSTLIDSFERRGDTGVLPMLRVGKGLPYATSIRQWKENGKYKVGVYQLVWTG